MIRERVADNVYVFTSELYAQVNAGAVIGPDFSVVIDTLAYPEETLEIRDFIENKLGSRVRYVINTGTTTPTMPWAIAGSRVP